MENTAPNTVTPDINSKSFTANGTEYFISEGMSIARYAAKQRMGIEFAFGSSLKQFSDTLAGTFNLLNSGKMAEAAVAIHNLLNGVAKSDENLIGAIELCTLFINRAGEDITVYDSAVMEQKKEDWKKGGIDASYFFRLAANSLEGYVAVWNEVFQNSLERTKADL